MKKSSIAAPIIALSLTGGCAATQQPKSIDTNLQTRIETVASKYNAQGDKAIILYEIAKNTDQMNKLLLNTLPQPNLCKQILDPCFLNPQKIEKNKGNVSKIKQCQESSDKLTSDGACITSVTELLNTTEWINECLDASSVCVEASVANNIPELEAEYKKVKAGEMDESKTFSCAPETPMTIGTYGMPIFRSEAAAFVKVQAREIKKAIECHKQ